MERPTQWKAQHLLDLLSFLVVEHLVQADGFLAQKFVHPDQRPVHHYETQLINLGVALHQQPWQLKRSLLFPHGTQRLLCHRRGVFLLPELDDRVGIVGAVLALRLEPCGLKDGHLDVCGEPFLRLLAQ